MLDAAEFGVKNKVVYTKTTLYLRTPYNVLLLTFVDVFFRAFEFI